MSRLKDYFDQAIKGHQQALNALQDQCMEPAAHMLAGWVAAIRDGNKIVFFGNGGSASDAQHLATEMSVKLKEDRAPIAGLALTTDSSALTAIGNDYGFDHLFERQIRALGRPGDIAVGISTSGNSANVNLAPQAAREVGMVATGLSGRDGGKMVGLCDPLIIVPSDQTAHIQEMHITLGHMLIGALEIELGLVPGN